MLDRFNLPKPMDLDLLDSLLSLGAIDGRLDDRCDLLPPWTIEQGRSAQREMPYHAVMSGSAVAQAPGLEPTTLHAGDVLLLPSGDPHRIVDREEGPERTEGGAHSNTRRRAAGTVTVRETPGEATVMLCGRFVFGYAAWRLYRSLLPNYVIVRARPAGEQNGHDGADAAPSRLNRLLGLMKEESDRPEPGYAAVLRHLSAALFGLALRAAVDAEQAPVGMIALAAHPRLRELAMRIVRAPGQAWTIEDMGEIANMSRSSLIRSFGAAAGMTPAEFVTRVRIAEAGRLLKETEQSVAAIGEAVGYASDAAFQRAFKRETDMTPAAWRAAPSPLEPARAPRFVEIDGAKAH
ncbi:AraC family transcriptional regulator [Trinickia dinghuensis]|nr:AraC family transcriptional regulator [Trinickia dinghuensis]